MGDLTKSEAQANMSKGLFVSHKSAPDTGFKLSAIGNVESHNGGVYSAAEFWYARRHESFDSGWSLHKSE